MESFVMYDDWMAESLLKYFNISRKTILSFDDDEQREVDKELVEHNDLINNTEFPAEVVEVMERGYASEVMNRLARNRMNSGSFKEAASPCVKSLALFPSNKRVWLLLAEIVANIYGNKGIKYSMECIKQAEYVHNQFKDSYIELPKPFDIDLDKSWKNEVNETKDIVNSKKKLSSLL